MPICRSAAGPLHLHRFQKLSPAANIRLIIALLEALSSLLIALVPAIACYVITRATSGHMYVWYVIFILPGVIILAALGLDDMLAAARTHPAKIAATAGVALLPGAHAVWTAPQRTFLQTHSIQPNRESVLLTRPSLDPNDPRQKDVITATFFGEPFPYDPRMITFHSMPKLAELIRWADAENKPLFINLGYLVSVEGEHPNKYEFPNPAGRAPEQIRLPAIFRALRGSGTHRRFENLHSWQVFQYIPGSVAGFDFNSVPVDLGSPGRDQD